MSYSRVESSSFASTHNPRSYRRFLGPLTSLRAIPPHIFSDRDAYWHGRSRRTVCHDSVMQQQQQQSSGWYEEDGKSMEELIEQIRSNNKYASSKKGVGGTVYLVGTGPGDPELLTLKSVRLLSQADVVLYDRLVSKEILNMVNPEAFMVYVGKQQSYHTRSQEEIQELMRMFAAELGQGATVVRLKGGDPYIFGRGGEEIGHLAEQGVEAHSVPGITAAAGIAADLGIPLTHRGLATSVRFMTGHAREGGQSDIDAAMATAFDLYTTLVIYMGLGTLEQTVSTLTQGGLPRDMPAVAVEKGTTPDQRAVWAPLENLHTRVEDAELKSPTLIIIGKVVSLAQGWRALYPCANDE
eukprot:jgi/Picre1/34389/NNA_001859.t1